jgi:hypothetical protein
MHAYRRTYAPSPGSQPRSLTMGHRHDAFGARTHTPAGQPTALLRCVQYNSREDSWMRWPDEQPTAVMTYRQCAWSPETSLHTVFPWSSVETQGHLVLCVPLACSSTARFESISCPRDGRNKLESHCSHVWSGRLAPRARSQAGEGSQPGLARRVAQLSHAHASIYTWQPRAFWNIFH